MTLPQSRVGIDVARAARIANEPKAFDAFLASLAGRAVTVVFEATGPYDHALRAALAEATIPSMRVNPARARDFARAAGYLAKLAPGLDPGTDAIDARMLAAMGRVIPLPEAEQPEPAREELALLSRQRDRLVVVRAEEKKRLLQSLMPAVRCSIERHIAWLAAEIDSLEKAIRALFAAQPTLAAARYLLTTAPGVGDVTATTLIAHMPELGRRSPKAIAALAGLAPLNNDSGDRRGRRTIRGGRPSCEGSSTWQRCQPSAACPLQGRLCRDRRKGQVEKKSPSSP
jgi:transposase